MFLENSKISIGAYVGIVIIGIFILCILIIGIIKVIQIVRKQIKRNKKSQVKDASDTLQIFGGEENIESIDVQLNRVSIKVKDKSQVSLDVLKAMNVGCQITGNIIKVSSKEIAESLENYKK